MSKEILDIFDENMIYTGTAERDYAHAKGLWHQTFQCWILLREGNETYLLFQKRSPEKKTYPDLFDITAAGHITSGEKPEDGVREIEEELGIKVEYDRLVSLGIMKQVLKEKTFEDKEFCHLFLYKCNIPLEEYTLQTSEVSGLVKIKVEDLLELFKDSIASVAASGFFINKDSVKIPVKIQLKKKDFVPHDANYYNIVFSRAQNLD